MTSIDTVTVDTVRVGTIMVHVYPHAQITADVQHLQTTGAQYVVLRFEGLHGAIELLIKDPSVLRDIATVVAQAREDADRDDLDNYAESGAAG